MTPALREHAEAMAWAIEHGFDAPGTAIDWACLLVAEQSDPSEELLELAGAIRPHPAEVARLLRNLPGPVDGTRVLRKIFSKYLDLLHRQHDAWPRVTRDLEQMTLDGEIPPPFDRACAHFDDALALAEQGIWGDPNQVKTGLLSFLEAQAEPVSCTGVLAFARRLCDSRQPGSVECVLTDAAGHDHVFVEKIPIVTTEDVSERTAYPQPVILGCAILGEVVRPDGMCTVTIDTSEPLDIRSTTGQTIFSVARVRVIAARIPRQCGPVHDRGRR